jgi:hypothetical protein
MKLGAAPKDDAQADVRFPLGESIGPNIHLNRSSSASPTMPCLKRGSVTFWHPERPGLIADIDHPAYFAQ